MIRDTYRRTPIVLKSIAIYHRMMSYTMADFTWQTTTWGPFISVEGWGYDIDRLSSVCRLLSIGLVKMAFYASSSSRSFRNYAKLCYFL